MTPRFLEWKSAHAGKRRYCSEREAWLAIVRIWLRERHMGTLHPYTCRWGYRWEDGRRAAPLHIHIGHGRYTPRQRLLHLVNLYVVWPCYRARTRWRRYRRRAVRLGTVTAKAARPAKWP